MKKILTGLVIAVAGYVLSRTFGQDIADRLNAAGVPKRTMDAALAVDWWHVAMLAGVGLWALIALAEAVLLVRWVRPYAEDETVFVDTDKAMVVTTVWSLFTGITAGVLLPDAWEQFAMAGVLGAYGLAGLRIWLIQRQRARSEDLAAQRDYERSLKAPAPERSQRNMALMIALTQQRQRSQASPTSADEAAPDHPATDA